MTLSYAKLWICHWENLRFSVNSASNMKNSKILRCAQNDKARRIFRVNSKTITSAKGCDNYGTNNKH